MAGDSRVYVWDWVIRLCHGIFIVGVPTAFLTYEFELMEWHVWNGYVLLAAVVVRVIWGFIGTPYARFRQFVRSPAAVWHYVRTWPQQPVPTGHNPLGGYAVLALLLVLAAQGTSGLFADDGILVAGPLASFVSADFSERLTDFHEFNFFYFLLPLLALHLGAVLLYRLVKKENLLWPMITGYKKH